MKVAGLYKKRRRGSPMEKATSLAMVKGTGIHGDANACVFSPRQALIASLPVIEELGIRETDLRANIIVDGLIEDFQSGDILKINDCYLRLTFRCEPCGKLEKAQKGLIKRIGDRRGFLAMVIDGGSIFPGDSLEKTSCRAKPIPDDIEGRFLQLANLIPKGRVIKTSDLITLLGLSSSYHRVLPSYIKRLSSRMPAHRIVSTKRMLLDKHLPRQSDELKQEGVVFENDHTVAEFSCWDYSEIFKYAYSFEDREVVFNPPTLNPKPTFKTMDMFS